MANTGPAPASLADRISQPSTPADSTTAPSAKMSSWADEVASPPADNSLEQAQLDGSSAPLGGSALHEVEYDVEVKLSDLQADINNPLYSVSSFENLGM